MGETVTTKSVADQVRQTARFWRDWDKRLNHLERHWRGREADYLNLVHHSLMEHLERCRTVLLYSLGFDVITKVRYQTPPPPDGDQGKADFLINVERTALDIITISSVVSARMQDARNNGNDPAIEGYKAYFWAMRNVPVRGTLDHMRETQGTEHAATIMLMAGWADKGLSLRSHAGTRLWDGVGASPHNAREQLREQLPGAVLEVAEEFPDYGELMVGEPRIPAEGKLTAGRGPRNLRSRIARKIERKSERRELEYIDDVETLATGNTFDTYGAPPIDAVPAAERHLLPAELFVCAQRAFREDSHPWRLIEFLICSSDSVTVDKNWHLRLAHQQRDAIAGELGITTNHVSKVFGRVARAVRDAAEKIE